jgi:hypothetical protein
MQNENGTIISDIQIKMCYKYKSFLSRRKGVGAGLALAELPQKTKIAYYGYAHAMSDEWKPGIYLNY